MRLLGKRLAESRPAISYDDARRTALTQARAYAVKEHSDGAAVPDVASLAACFLNGLEEERKIAIGLRDDGGYSRRWAGAKARPRVMKD
jgi:hypothetical protein